jgi:hypothetical protein
MGSTTQQCSVYGGEYAPTGLRLFVWWKKNGERRLRKPGSDSAQISSQKLKTAARVLVLFLKGGTVGENPTAIFYISQRAKYREFTNGKEPKIKRNQKETKKTKFVQIYRN